jgi:ribonucleotide reductase beta subunit family protein with ferritin-like domain
MSSVSLSNADLRRLIEKEKKEEPILVHNPNRFGTIPIEDPIAWSFYKKAEKIIWPADEIDWTQDVIDWNTKLIPDERLYVSKTLSFFYGFDGIIMENIACRFFEDVQCPSSRAFYSVQILVEQVHNEGYGKSLFTLISDPVEREKLMQGLQHDPYIKRKGDWGLYYKTKETTFAERLLAFGIVEGIFFQASFCAIFFLKKRGLMPGLVLLNSQISKDEGLHFEFAAYLYRKLKIAKLPLDDFNRVVRNAVNVEIEYVQSLLPVKLIGMNVDLMVEYLKFIADRFCVAFGMPIIYGAHNPFDWMEMISMDGKTNFFENRVAEYQRYTDIDQSIYYEHADAPAASSIHPRVGMQESTTVKPVRLGSHSADNIFTHTSLLVNRPPELSSSCIMEQNQMPLERIAETKTNIDDPVYF